ncbi:uncharacterized protein LOC114424100 [Glycine soja]|nr:uncharacterized protein LOC114424100 [Glycine soja]
MAHIPDKIKTIDGSKETLRLAVRITDLWFVGVADKLEQAEMVMVDSNGDEIHAICKQDQLNTWKIDLKENCTYAMHNFRVIKNDGQYKVCDHTYKLAFTRVTIVRQCELDGFPLKRYKFVEFSNVIDGQFEPGLLVDIIGVVDEVVFHHVSSRSRRVVFKLRDLSDQLLSCIIWDNYCLQFLEYLDEHESESPIIVLLTNARIKEGQGSYPPSVGNSLKASKLAINELVVQIQEFNQRLSKLGIEVRSVLTHRGQGSSQLSGSTQLSSKETYISKSEAKTISEINNICEDDDMDLNASPKALDKLLGNVLAFKIKVQPKYKNSAVLKCSSYLSLINNVLDMLPDAEACSKINVTMLDSNNPAQHESQSISITADHDPLIGLPLTPTK